MTYEELRKKRAEKYQGMYTQALEDKDTEKAWKVMKTMMRYQLIDKNEALAEIKKQFKGKKLDPADTFDYRHQNSYDRVPDNLLFKAPSTVEVRVKSEEHWIRRRELQFVGDQIAPEKTFKFDISRCTLTRSASRALKDLDELFKKLSGTELKTNWKSGIDNGNVMMYTVKLGNNQQYVINTLGFMVCVPNGKNLNMYILLDNKDMEEQHIDIIDTYTDMMKTLKREFIGKGLEADKIQTIGLCDFKMLGEKQRANKKPLLTHEEMLNLRIDEYNQEQLENEAAKLRISVEDLLKMKERLSTEDTDKKDN